jgi:hypothetical protein
MTQEITQVISRPAAPPGAARAAREVARRALRKYFRTPGLFVMGMVQAGLFLFSFRFVFGGAIHAGGTSYVNYLVPGYVATIVLFTGGGIAVAVAEDRAEGFTDRLLSLPIPRLSIVAGRALADFTTNAWSIVFTAAAAVREVPAGHADGGRRPVGARRVRQRRGPGPGLVGGAAGRLHARRRAAVPAGLTAAGPPGGPAPGTTGACRSYPRSRPPAA